MTEEIAKGVGLRLPDHIGQAIDGISYIPSSAKTRVLYCFPSVTLNLRVTEYGFLFNQHGVSYLTQVA